MANPREHGQSLIVTASCGAQNKILGGPFMDLAVGPQVFQLLLGRSVLVTGSECLLPAARPLSWDDSETMKVGMTMKT